MRGGSDPSIGRASHVLLPAGTFQVTEDYDYGGRGGRVSERYTTVSDGTSSRVFLQSFAYHDLGGASILDYPCEVSSTSSTTCLDAQRSVEYLYDLGRIESIGAPGDLPGQSTYVLEAEYHSNGMLSKLEYPAVPDYVLGKDPDDMARPSSFNDGTTTHALGYDPSGNVTQVGSATYAYDAASRLITADLSSTLRKRYSYDPFGNLYEFERWDQTLGFVPTTYAIDELTNRIEDSSGSGTDRFRYDIEGNMTMRPGAGADDIEYEWTRLGQMESMTSSQQTHSYVYTADDERILVIDDAGLEEWTLRGLDGLVLRKYHTDSTGTLYVDRDIVFAGGQQIANHEPNGERYFYFNDHLGSPRSVWQASNGQLATDYLFWPYGEQAVPAPESQGPNGDSVRATLRFTGHERDLGVEGDALDDLDYMHARYHSPLLGRFLSADPVQGRLAEPRSWNRYPYVSGNPMTFTDPFGLMESGTKEEPFEFETTVCEDAFGAPCSSGHSEFTLFGQWLAGGRGGLNDLPSGLGFRAAIGVHVRAGLGGGGDANTMMLQSVSEIAPGMRQLELRVAYASLAGLGFVGAASATGFGAAPTILLSSNPSATAIYSELLAVGPSSFFGSAEVVSGVLARNGHQLRILKDWVPGSHMLIGNGRGVYTYISTTGEVWIYQYGRLLFRYTPR